MLGAILTLTAAAVEAPPAAPLPVVESASPAEPALAVGTPIRLMVVREITSRSAKIGDQFKLRVDEAVSSGGTILVPIGATAWAEIVSVDKNGAVGKGGRIALKLLHLDLPAGKVPLKGDYADRGKHNTAGVAIAMLGFGVLGLLNGGDSGRLEAGDTFTGYIDGPATDKPKPGH